MFPVFLLYINDYKKESSEYEFNIFIAFSSFFHLFYFLSSGQSVYFYVDRSPGRHDSRYILLKELYLRQSPDVQGISSCTVRISRTFLPVSVKHADGRIGIIAKNCSHWTKELTEKIFPVYTFRSGSAPAG